MAQLLELAAAVRGTRRGLALRMPPRAAMLLASKDNAFAVF